MLGRILGVVNVASDKLHFVQLSDADIEGPRSASRLAADMCKNVVDQVGVVGKSAHPILPLCKPQCRVETAGPAQRAPFDRRAPGA